MIGVITSVDGALFCFLVGDSVGTSLGGVVGEASNVVPSGGCFSGGKASLNPCPAVHSPLNDLMKVLILLLSSPFSTQWDDLFLQS